MVRRFLYLNGAAILSVVIFHALGMGFVAMFDWAHRYLPASASANSAVGSLGYYVLRLLEQIVVFCIPAFLFVSGFFVAAASGRSRDTISWEIVLARVKKLLIPYLIWSLIAMALQVVLQGDRISFEVFVINLLIGRSNDVLYFVPLLIQFYLLSPWLVRLVRWNWKVVLGVAGILQLCVQLLPYSVYLGLNIPWMESAALAIPRWLFLARIFWFPLGIVFGFYLDQFKASLYKLRWVWFTIALILIPAGAIEWEVYYRLSGLTWLPHRETILDSVYTIATLFSFFGFSDIKLPMAKALERLGKDSYGIYLTHALFILYLAKIIYHAAPQLLAHQILFTGLLFIASLFGPLALMRLSERTPFRRFYGYLFG